ncbi:MAG: radical SAM family heme chaperone HemW [Verrucomicrobiota bacterium]
MALKTENSSARPLVAHLYVHIPLCTRICPYCSFYKHTPGKTDQAALVEALLAEATLRLRRLEVRPTTIYLGGGTPTALDASHLARLLEGIHRLFDLRHLAEWTVEANPRTFEDGKALLLKQAGVTRISLGNQTWNPRLLKLLGRDHHPQQAIESYWHLREIGLPLINLDHMFALPTQTLSEWQKDLEQTIQLQPDHISAYNLTYEEDTHFMKRYQKGDFEQDDDQDADFFRTADTLLTSAGYHHYEISNYSHPGKESLHNRAYWAGADYLGLGPSAVTTVGGQRWKTLPHTQRYIAALQAGEDVRTEKETLQTADTRLERIALGLRTTEGISLSLLGALPEADPRVDDLLHENLVQKEKDRLSLTPRGRVLADEIAAYLA